MRVILFFIAFVIYFIGYTQNYKVSFVGDGEGKVVDSVLVENLTRKTKISMLGSHTLHLVGPVGAREIHSLGDDIRLFCEPAMQRYRLLINTIVDEDVIIEISSLSGKSVAITKQFLEKGSHYFEISDIQRGVYFVNVHSKRLKKTVKLMSSSSASSKPTIQLVTFKPIDERVSEYKSTAELIQFDYYVGDILLYTCYSGSNVTIRSDVPTKDMVVKVQFIDFADKAGVHYKLLQVNDQVWMAENMAYLPSVTYPGVTGSKNNPFPIYSVPDYLGSNVEEAKKSEGYVRYGVLYNWYAAVDVCPEGWRLPTDEDWTTLERSLCKGANCKEKFPYDDPYGDFRGTNEGAMLAGNYSLWKEGDLRSNPAFGTSGFSGPPAGVRTLSGYQGKINESTTWWSSTEVGTSAWTRGINQFSGSISRAGSEKNNGHSVRCVKK